MGHNTWFRWEIRKMITKYSLWVQMLRKVASGNGLRCLHTGVSMQNTITKWKLPPETPKIRNGPIRMIQMEKSTGQKGLNISIFVFQKEPQSHCISVYSEYLQHSRTERILQRHYCLVRWCFGNNDSLCDLWELESEIPGKGFWFWKWETNGVDGLFSVYGRWCYVKNNSFLYCISTR